MLRILEGAWSATSCYWIVSRFGGFLSGAWEWSVLMGQGGGLVLVLEGVRLLPDVLFIWEGKLSLAGSINSSQSLSAKSNLPSSTSHHLAVYLINLQKSAIAGLKIGAWRFSNV